MTSIVYDMKAPIFLRILTILAFHFVTIIPTQAQVDFVDADFISVVEKAKSTNKLVMVDAYTDWCGWCKVMDRETFSDSLVGVFVNERLVSTKVNMEEGFGLDLAMKYRVSFYPQYLFFDGDGQLIGRLGGYIESAPFIAQLTEIITPDNYLPQLSAPMDFVMDYPVFYKNSFKKRKDRTYPSEQEVTTFLDSRSDLTDEVSWAVISRFVSDGKYADSVISNRVLLSEKFGTDEVVDKLASFVFAEVKTAIKDSSEVTLLDALDSADELLGPEAENYKLRYRLYFYQMTQDWDAYTAIGNEIAKSAIQYDASTLNQIAWNLYEHDLNESNLKDAVWWMKIVSEKEPTYAYLDTYAAILFKVKNYSEAKTVAKRAIDAANAEDTNPKETEALLEMINALI